jgi:hypothetical protein
MEYSYNNWFMFKEMSSHLTSDISDVNLKDRGYKLVYEFEVNDKEYKVTFSKIPIKWSIYDDKDNHSVRIADKMYTINFSHGPDGELEMPGDTKMPTAVYGEVFRAIRKLIEVYHPEALTFYGAYNKQDAMYDLFYRKYLSKMFTRIDTRYLRNDLYEAYKAKNDKEWELLQNHENDVSYLQSKIKAGKADRDTARLARRRSKLTATSSNPHNTSSNPHNTSSNPHNMHTRQRGDVLPNGGRYVGTTPAGVEWVAYSDHDYNNMVIRFDSMYSGPEGWSSI